MRFGGGPSVLGRRRLRLLGRLLAARVEQILVHDGGHEHRRLLLDLLVRAALAAAPAAAGLAVRACPRSFTPGSVPRAATSTGGRVRRHVSAICEPQQEHDEAQDAVEDRPATHQSFSARGCFFRPRGAIRPAAGLVVLVVPARMVVVTPPGAAAGATVVVVDAPRRRRDDRARRTRRRADRWRAGARRRRTGAAQDPWAPDPKDRTALRGLPRRPPAAWWSWSRPPRRPRRLRLPPPARPPPPSPPRRARSPVTSTVAESVRGPFAPGTAPRRFTSTNGIASCWSYSSPDISSANGLSSPDSVEPHRHLAIRIQAPLPSSPACSGR